MRDRGREVAGGREGGTALGEWKEQTFAFSARVGTRGGSEVSAGGSIMRSSRGAKRNKLI